MKPIHAAFATALLAITTFPALAQTSTQPGTFQVISKASFTGTWPFTVEQGTLSCYRGQGIVFNTGGKTYAINGTAQSLGKSLGYTWQRVNPIWRDNPSVPGTKVPVSDIIKTGQTLCRPWP